MLYYYKGVTHLVNMEKKMMCMRSLHYFATKFWKESKQHASFLAQTR